MPRPIVESVLDLEQIAERLALPTDVARTLLALHNQRPAAQYRGKPLWLSDAVHVVLDAEGPR